MKLCKDCRWYRMERVSHLADGLLETAARGYCQHPRAMRIDYVDGHHTQYTAAAQRNGKGELFCGPEGQDFEPKEGAPNEPAS